MKSFRLWLTESIDLSRFEDFSSVESLAKVAIDQMDWSGGDGDHYRSEASLELHGWSHGCDDDENVEKKAMELAIEDIQDKLYEKLWIFK